MDSINRIPNNHQIPTSKVLRPLGKGYHPSCQKNTYSEEINDNHLYASVTREEDDEEEEEEGETTSPLLKLDLSQIAVLLLIPKLREIRYDEEKDASNKRASSFLSRNRIFEDDNFDSTNTTTTSTRNIDMVDGVLEIILKETRIPYGSEITKDVLKQMLACFDLVWSDAVLDSMLQAAIDACGTTPPLDRLTLLKVLTDDLGALNVNLGDTKASLFEEAATSSVIVSLSDQGKLSTEKERTLERIYTAGNIDANADTYKSNAWHILAWYSIVVTLFCYLFQWYSSRQILW